MGIYYFILVLLLAEAFVFNNNRQDQPSKERAFFLTVLFLALVAGCRSMDVGHDTYNYSNIFARIADYSLGTMLEQNSYSSMEQGYVWLCWLFSKISDNFSHFLIVTALFEFLAVGNWIWRNSRRPFIALLIFVCMFYTFFLTGIRQTLALCILLFAYEDVKNSKPLRFAVKVLIAMQFHFSALIFLPVYLIPKIFQGCGKLFVAMLVALPVIYVIRDRLFYVVINIFARYSDWNILNHGDPVTYTLMLVLIVCLSVLLLYMVPIRDLREEREYCSYTNYLIIAILIMPFVGLNGSIMRAAMYFSIFVCLQIEKIYGRFKNHKMRVTAVLISIALLSILFIRELQGSSYLYEFVGFDQLFS